MHIVHYAIQQKALYATSKQLVNILWHLSAYSSDRFLLSREKCKQNVIIMFSHIFQNV